MSEAVEEKFNRILPHTLGFEGGLTSDHAGLTNHGVTQRAFDAFNESNDRTKKSVKDITYGEVRDLYFNDFYKKQGFDKLPERLSGVIFDYAVNSGPARASKALQRAVSAQEDGIIGPKTMKKVSEEIERGGEESLIEKVISDRENFLVSLVEENPEKFGRFAEGWANRVSKVREIYQSGSGVTAGR